ncbi:hypothetical protein [Spiroplasma endosymbiont of Danaus chrysippus]|nr:hypothetical protein [Spiroplasma endosymbiont of Danaus chrysippus]
MNKEKLLEYYNDKLKQHEKRFRRYKTKWTFNCKSFNGCTLYDWKN